MLNDQLIELAFQGCMNTYKGQYGPVVNFLDNKKEFTVKHTEGHCGVFDNKLWIFYQGSHGKKDWFDNFKCWHTDVKTAKPYGNISSDVEVHSGFLTQYEIVRPTILEIVKNFDGTDIITSGHSLGGSLTTLCAVDIEYNFPDKNIAAVTLGSPRVGNYAFAASYNRRVPETYRFVNGKDAVPMVPFRNMGYAEVGLYSWIGERCWYKLFSFDDHYPDHYMNHYRESVGITTPLALLK